MKVNEALKDILNDKPAESINIDYWFIKSQRLQPKIVDNELKVKRKYSYLSFIIDWNLVGPLIEKNKMEITHYADGSLQVEIMADNPKDYIFVDSANLLEAVKRCIIKKEYR